MIDGKAAGEGKTIQTNKMVLEVMSLPENLGLTRVAVASFAAQLDLTINDLEEIKVAVSEAVTNAIVHGYDGRADGIVKITAIISGPNLELEIQDWGKGMENVQEAMQSPECCDGEEDRLGLGFTFIKTFMEQVGVWSEPGRGTKVTMRRSLPRMARTAVLEN